MIPFIPILTGLFSLGKDIASGWLKRKQITIEHKTKMAEMKLELKEKRLQCELDAEQEIDKINTENMATSYKDEYLLVLFSIPVIMCFIPTLDIYVLAGFAALKQTPIWYQVIFVVMSLTIYGHRKLAKLFAKNFLGTDEANDDKIS